MIDPAMIDVGDVVWIDTAFGTAQATVVSVGKKKVCVAVYGENMVGEWVGQVGFCDFDQVHPALLSVGEEVIGNGNGDGTPKGEE